MPKVVKKSVGRSGSAPNPTGGAHSTLLDPPSWCGRVCPGTIPNSLSGLDKTVSDKCVLLLSISRAVMTVRDD